MFKFIAIGVSPESQPGVNECNVDVTTLIPKLPDLRSHFEHYALSASGTIRLSSLCNTVEIARRVDDQTGRRAVAIV